MVELLKDKENIIIKSQATNERIGSLSADASAYFSQADDVGRTTAAFLKIIADPACGEVEINFLIKALKSKSEEQAAFIEKGNEILKQIIDSIGSNKGGQHIVDQLDYFIQMYKDFLSTLTLEQLVPLTNLLGLTIITFSLVSITTVLFSDYLIKYFNIENKFPRIAKFVQLRRKFQ